MRKAVVARTYGNDSDRLAGVVWGKRSRRGQEGSPDMVQFTIQEGSPDMVQSGEQMCGNQSTDRRERAAVQAEIAQQHMAMQERRGSRREEGGEGGESN
eukprot:2331803-Rhodomonas_salina.1